MAAEFRAARSAAVLLGEQLQKDPNYGDEHGWTRRAGRDFRENLEATYAVRLYAEFEAGLRDYWRNCRGRDTEPPMSQLVKDLIPDQSFPQDFVDGADEVRLYRNHLVHPGDDPPPAPLQIREVERRLVAYLACLRPDW